MNMRVQSYVVYGEPEWLRGLVIKKDRENINIATMGKEILLL